MQLIRVSNGDTWIIVLSILVFSLRAIYDIVKYKRTKTKYLYLLTYRFPPFQKLNEKHFLFNFSRTIIKEYTERRK